MLDSLPDLQIGLGRAPDVKVLLRSEGPVWGESHPVPAVIVSKTTCFSPGPGHSGPVHEDAAGFGSDSTKRTRPPSLQGLGLPPIRLRQPRELHVNPSSPPSSLIKPTSLIKPSSLIRPPCWLMRTISHNAMRKDSILWVIILIIFIFFGQPPV